MEWIRAGGSVANRWVTGWLTGWTGWVTDRWYALSMVSLVKEDEENVGSQAFISLA